jgi:hypothetical protein
LSCKNVFGMLSPIFESDDLSEKVEFFVSVVLESLSVDPLPELSSEICNNDTSLLSCIMSDA